MILHINKHLTDTVNHKEILNNFITINDEWDSGLFQLLLHFDPHREILL